MDVWITISLTVVIVVFVDDWLRERRALRRAWRELASSDHTPPFERTDP
jgi:hypothetical protein